MAALALAPLVAAAVVAFAGRPRGPASEQHLQGRNAVGQEGGMVSALHCKSEGPVEPGQLIRLELFGLSFPESHPRDPQVAFNFVVQRHCITPHVQPSREGLELLPGLLVHEL